MKNKSLLKRASIILVSFLFIVSICSFSLSTTVLAAGSGKNGTGTTTTTTTTSDATSCDTSGFSLAWMLCPVIDGLSHLVNDLYQQVLNPLLQPIPLYTTNSVCTNNGNSTGPSGNAGTTTPTGTGTTGKTGKKATGTTAINEGTGVLEEGTGDTGTTTPTGTGVTGTTTPTGTQTGDTGATGNGGTGTTATGTGDTGTVNNGATGNGSQQGSAGSTGNCTTTNATSASIDVYKIWSWTRSIGDIVLVIALFALVFFESLGAGKISAYSVRKFLPRLLIAAVAVNLSIYIVAALIDVGNVVGSGVSDLIYSPLSSELSKSGSIYVNLGTSNPGNLGLLQLLTSNIWSWGLGATFLVSMIIVPVSLIMLGVLLVAMLRFGLLILLALLSPLAFGLYAIPGMEDYFKKWWSMLFKTILIYPLIALFFFLANISSIVVSSGLQGVSNQGLVSVLTIAALFVPLAFILFSYKFSGNIVAMATSLSGYVGERVGARSTNAYQPKSSSTSSYKQGSSIKTMTQKYNGSSVFMRPRQVYLSLTTRNTNNNGGNSNKSNKARQTLPTSNPSSVPQKSLLAVADPELAKSRREEVAQQISRTRAMGQYQADQPLEKELKDWDQAISTAQRFGDKPEARMQAIQSLAKTGSQFSVGQAGYNEMAKAVATGTGASPANIIRDKSSNIVGVAGPSAKQYEAAMNEVQTAAQNAGRFDLGAPNSGKGFDLESSLNTQKNQPDKGDARTFVAGAARYLGASLVGPEKKETPDTAKLEQEMIDNLNSMSITVNEVAIWYSKLLEAQSEVVDPAAKQEVDKQISVINYVSNQPVTDSSPWWLKGLKDLIKTCIANASQYLSSGSSNSRSTTSQPEDITALISQFEDSFNSSQDISAESLTNWYAGLMETKDKETADKNEQIRQQITAIQQIASKPITGSSPAWLKDLKTAVDQVDKKYGS